jgi:hypothetical protein
MAMEPLTALAAVDIRDLAGTEPEALMLDPAPLWNQSPRSAAARALKYARAGRSGSYDEIGFRTSAMTPWRGPAPLQTTIGMRLERQLDLRRHGSSLLEEVTSQQPQLRHRPLELPLDGRFRYEIRGGVIDFIGTRTLPDGGESEERWSFPLSRPPDILLQQAEDADALLLAAQLLMLDLPGQRWLPLSRLVESGRFLRMQEWADDLEQQTAPGRFYSFVSHRWQTPTHPDPDGLQARVTAWQLFAYLCDAIRIAHLRGLHQPRRRNPLVGAVVGVAGTELAESLLVNILRRVLSDDEVVQAMEEVRVLDTLIEDYGVATATRDDDLDELAGALDSSPVLRTLVDRIFVWYDYSCLPQPPRTDAEETLFRQGLEALNACQVLGRTVVLLDEAEDYLSRAWCTLEALIADKAQTVDLLVGSQRATASEGRAEHYFEMLMEDRPHVVWRALLDTEVFGVQTAERCMTRLALAATDPRDLPFIYGRLHEYGGPSKVHIDDSEVVTGVFPMPVVDEGRAALVMKQAGRLVGPSVARSLLSLDWSASMSLATGWNSEAGDDPRAVPPFLQLAPTPDGDSTNERPTCHVAIMGSCEGEAVLLGNWVLKHRGQIEQGLEVSVESLSWLAIDVAPVGHFVHCQLQAMAISAPVWLIVALGRRLTNCQVTGLVTEALAFAGIVQFHVAVDEARHNVYRIERDQTGTESQVAGEMVMKVQLSGGPFPVHAGGLFRAALLDHLL